MDDADAAQALIDKERECALAKRARVAPVGDCSPPMCDECGLGIPKARRQAVPGTRHCTECAGYLEAGR